MDLVQDAHEVVGIGKCEASKCGISGRDGETEGVGEGDRESSCKGRKVSSVAGGGCEEWG